MDVRMVKAMCTILHIAFLLFERVAGADPPNMKEAVFWHPCQDEVFSGNIFKVRKMHMRSSNA